MTRSDVEQNGDTRGDLKQTSDERMAPLSPFWATPRILLLLSLPMALGLWLLSASAFQLSDPWNLFLAGIVRLYFYTTMVCVIYLQVKRLSSTGRYDTLPMLLDVTLMLVVQAILWQVK